MLRCFPTKATQTQSPNSSPPANPNLPSSSSANPQISLTVNLSTEYKENVTTESFKQIWYKIHQYQNSQSQNENSDEDDEEDEGREDRRSIFETNTTTELIAQVLQPNRDSVEEAIQKAKPSNLRNLVESYFNQSENTSRLVFNLHRNVDQARSLYAPLLSLLEILPLDSLISQPQCDFAFDVFNQFDSKLNPFPEPNSENFDEMRRCFCQLKFQLDRRLIKARKQLRLRRSLSFSVLSFLNNSRFCLSGNFAEKQLHHIAQIDAASKGTYVLNNDLDTIDRLVTRLYGVVESDKLLVRLGLERGKDRYLIQEVVKQLHKNHSNFLIQLKDLEEHLCLCFATVNRARGLLLQEIDI
ncbi:hypothetical protein MKW94_024652 [Papaver nudicaule]|uniref:Uncharacterized protein n=1 Tax=Papaver nudicaule TaxID=74823 RepID=A0AA41SF11_PAPNU|nr:hypothetical protein [Papaver nudicaule]